MSSPLSLLGVTDVAEILGVTTRTVQRWIRAGHLPAHKMRGATGSYVVRAEDVEALIERRAS